MLDNNFGRFVFVLVADKNEEQTMTMALCSAAVVPLLAFGLQLFTFYLIWSLEVAVFNNE